MSTNTKRKGAKLPNGFIKVAVGDEIKAEDKWHYDDGTEVEVCASIGENLRPHAKNVMLIRAIKHPAPKVAKKAAVKAVWVVEILEGRTWKPCAEAAILRKDGRRVIQDEWLANHPNDKFRLSKYVPASLGIIAKRKAKK